MLNSSSGRGRAEQIPHVRQRNRPHFWLLDFYGSAIGKKAVMALTGIMLLGFVLMHMIGNLKIYTGETHLNAYGEYLREIGEPILPHTAFLWILRSGLILAFVLHIHAAFSLTMLNRRARPQKYEGGRSYVAASYAARTMRWSGIIVGAFLVFHLMDMTWGYHVVHSNFQDGKPYENLIHSFSRDRWWIAGVYIIANVLLGIHIYHGAWSLFQSLGWNNPRFNVWRKWFARAFAAAIVIGNVSIPIAVLTGVVS